MSRSDRSRIYAGISCRKWKESGSRFVRNRLQLNDLLFAEVPDMKTIAEKSSEISALQAKLEREVIDHILQEKEFLSPEQKRDFYQVIRNEFDKGGLGVHGERGTAKNR